MDIGLDSEVYEIILLLEVIAKMIMIVIMIVADYYIYDHVNKDYIDQIFQISTKMGVDEFIFFTGWLKYTYIWNAYKNEIKKEL